MGLIISPNSTSLVPGTTPIVGGTDTRIPFNDSGVYNEDSGLVFNKTTDQITSVLVNASTGYKVNGAASSGKILKADGTNFVASTETYAAPSTNGNMMTSDGTNWGSVAPTYNEYVRGIRALGSTQVITAPLYMAQYQEDGPFYNFTLTDGRVQYCACYLDVPTTILGVKWYQITQGSYTADNNSKVGLYSYSAGVITLQASCANDTALWKVAANSWGTKAFSSGYAAPAGVYFIAFLWNASATTTAPVISAGRALNNANQVSMDMTNNASLSIRKTGTDLPSSLTLSTKDADDISKPFVVIYS